MYKILGRDPSWQPTEVKDIKTSAECHSAVISPVLDTALIIFNSKENGSDDEGEENVDSQLHRRKHETFRHNFCHCISAMTKKMYSLVCKISK